MSFNSEPTATVNCVLIPSRMSGVRPRCVVAETSAPSCSIQSTMSAFLLVQAQWIAVDPLWSCSSYDAPRRRSSFRGSSFPAPAASISLAQNLLSILHVCSSSTEGNDRTEVMNEVKASGHVVYIYNDNYMRYSKTENIYSVMKCWRVAESTTSTCENKLQENYWQSGCVCVKSIQEVTKSTTCWVVWQGWNNPGRTLVLAWVSWACYPNAKKSTSISATLWWGLLWQLLVDRPKKSFTDHTKLDTFALANAVHTTVKTSYY